MTAKRASGSGGIRRERTPFEWALLAVSLAATLAVVVGLVVSGLAGSRGPADLRVSIAAADEPASGGRPLEVTVTNAGGTSAENVIVEIRVGDVTREINLDIVAKGDTETATVVIPADAAGPPHAEVVSYTNPRVLAQWPGLCPPFGQTPASRTELTVYASANGRALPDVASEVVAKRLRFDGRGRPSPKDPHRSWGSGPLHRRIDDDSR